MRQSEKEKILDLARKLSEVTHTLINALIDIADETEATRMKKTTQRSPEWRGRANCKTFAKETG